jgi:hypothetical protein
MALPDYIRNEPGTEITFKSSGGTAAISIASVANAASPATSSGARQSAKADFGATHAEWFDVFMSAEMAATPTAGAVIDLYLSPSSSATAGTDNLGNCSGADASYTGYSNNIDAAVKQLIYVGALVLTAQATTTVQSGFVGSVRVPQRYGSVVVVNRGGSAIHSSDSNCTIRFVPQSVKVEET